METKFLSRAHSEATLIALVEDCVTIPWAAAWARGTLPYRH